MIINARNYSVYSGTFGQLRALRALRGELRKRNGSGKRVHQQIAPVSSQRTCQQILFLYTLYTCPTLPRDSGKARSGLRHSDRATPCPTETCPLYRSLAPSPSFHELVCVSVSRVYAFHVRRSLATFPSVAGGSFPPCDCGQRILSLSISQ